MVYSPTVTANLYFSSVHNKALESYLGRETMCILREFHKHINRAETGSQNKTVANAERFGIECEIFFLEVEKS